MAFVPPQPTFAQGASTTAAVDAGLRSYMLRVYNWMASGLLLTGLTAFAIANTSAMDLFYPLAQTANGLRHVSGPLAIPAMLAPLAFVLVLSFGINRLSRTAVQAIFWAFCIAMGASITSILFRYTGESIARTFFVTAGTFAAMSIWGYSTKRDLTGMGNFLVMGLFGIIIGSVVNMFIGSSGMQFIISILGVLIFTGLTAYDTQRIKSSYYQSASASGMDDTAKRSVYDALSLYLNFINLFMMLLQLTGNRSSNS